MECFYKLFHFDFEAIETLLEVKCFSILTEYHSMAKAENTYNKSVSEKVKELAGELRKATDAEGFFDIVTNFYRVYGVGKFGLNKAFRVTHTSNGELNLAPITHTSDVTLEHLVGYEIQKSSWLTIPRHLWKGERQITVFCLATAEPENPLVSRQY